MKKLVTIHWLDHASDSAWQSPEDLKEWAKQAKKKPCVTRGEIAYEDKDVVILADGHDGHGNWGNTSLIFKKLIVKR